jgi:hypothetical protein
MTSVLRAPHMSTAADIRPAIANCARVLSRDTIEGAAIAGWSAPSHRRRARTVKRSFHAPRVRDERRHHSKIEATPAPT